ncbi:MAG: hypothetical protein WC861_05510 [Candidatus Micrarchaeia archaeon]|jgi:hypothetical protein
MADSQMWLLLAVAVLVLMLAVAYWRWNRGKRPLLDYRTLFYTGLIWLVIGLPTNIPEIWFFGLVFIAVGLAKRGGWKEKK